MKNHIIDNHNLPVHTSTCEKMYKKYTTLHTMYNSGQKNKKAKTRHAEQADQILIQLWEICFFGVIITEINMNSSTIRICLLELDRRRRPRTLWVGCP